MSKTTSKVLRSIAGGFCFEITVYLADGPRLYRGFGRTIEQAVAAAKELVQS
jgi:hypothetical protein